MRLSSGITRIACRTRLLVFVFHVDGRRREWQMGLIDRPYMRQDFAGRPRVGLSGRLRFALWLLVKSLRSLWR